MQNLQSALGVVAIIAFAWAISENHRVVSPRRIAVGLVVAFVLAVLFLKVPPVTRAFASANHVKAAPAPPSCSAISAAARCLTN
jgi:CNT family concentrative nucleoside transporter